MEKEISIDTTEALITVGRIGKVINIVVSTVENLNGDGIILGVARTLKVNCPRHDPFGHRGVPVK